MANQPIIEKHTSRSTSIKQGTASQTREYSLRGYADEDAALSALTAYAPTAISVSGAGLTVDDINLRTIVAYEAAGAESVMEATISYTTPDLQDKRPPVTPSDPELVSGDFASRTTYVQLADKQLNAYWHTYKADRTVKTWDHTLNGGAGGVVAVQSAGRTSGWYTSESGVGDASGREAHPSWEGNQIAKDSRQSLPMGCEKNIAASTFTVTKVMSAATVTNAWLYARMSQVWTMNNAVFRSLAARTTMLTGMQSSQRASGDWDITYNFEFRPYVQMQIPSPKSKVLSLQSFDTAGQTGSATKDQGYYNPAISGTTRNNGWVNDFDIHNIDNPAMFPYTQSDLIVPPATATQEYFEFSAWDYFYLKTKEVQTEVEVGDFGDGIDAGASYTANGRTNPLEPDARGSLTTTGFSISRIYKETNFGILGIGT